MSLWIFDSLNTIKRVLFMCGFAFGADFTTDKLLMFVARKFNSWGTDVKWISLQGIITLAVKLLAVLLLLRGFGVDLTAC